MEKFIVTCDSSCDMNLATLQEHRVTPIFMTYELDGELYKDTMEEAGILEFYDKMRAGGVPRSSQINTTEMVEFWRPLLDQNLPIVHISLGSKISGTYANCVAARDMLQEEYPNAQIFPVDGTSASAGSAPLIMKAVAMRDAGEAAEDCVAWIDAHKQEYNAYYTTPDLTYLCRGGRVSKTGAVLGSLLNINPLMNLTIEGELKLQEKIRGEKACLKRLNTIVAHTVLDAPGQVLYVSHSDCIEKAERIGEGLRKEFGFQDVVYSYIGAIIGCHTGPGLVSIFFRGKSRNETGKPIDHD